MFTYQNGTYVPRIYNLSLPLCLSIYLSIYHLSIVYLSIYLSIILKHKQDEKGISKGFCLLLVATRKLCMCLKFNITEHLSVASGIFQFNSKFLMFRISKILSHQWWLKSNMQYLTQYYIVKYSYCMWFLISVCRFIRVVYTSILNSTIGRILTYFKFESFIVFLNFFFMSLVNGCVPVYTIVYINY